MKLRKQIMKLSNFEYSTKPYNIKQYDRIFNSYPNKEKYLKHKEILTKGVKIGLSNDYPSRTTNDNPTFSNPEKIGIGVQLQKWLKTGVVMGPFDKSFAKKNNALLHMLFGVPRPDGTTRPILNLSDKKEVGFSINDLLDPTLCTVEYAQTKQVVETVRALGKGAWLWAKDLKDGYYNVSVHKSDVLKLGFVFEERVYFSKDSQ